METKVFGGCPLTFEVEDKGAAWVLGPEQCCPVELFSTMEMF